jgi:hypothetical protein
VEGQLRVGRIIFHQQDFNYFGVGQGSPRFVDLVRAARLEGRE